MKTMLNLMVKRALMVMLVFAGMVVATVTPAAAANPGCGFCEDKAPDYQILIGQYDWYTCADDGYVVYRRAADSFWVDLYYSPRCRTAWAYTSSPVAFWVERLDPYRINYGTVNRYYGNVWSRMVYDAGYVSRACFGEPYGGILCTNWW